MITVGDIIGILYYTVALDIQDEDEETIASYYFNEEYGEGRFTSHSNISKSEILKRKVVEIGAYDVDDMWIVTGKWG